MKRNAVIGLLVAMLAPPACAQSRVEAKRTAAGDEYRLREGGAEAVLLSGLKQPSYRVRVTGIQDQPRQFAALDTLLLSVWAAGGKPAKFSFVMGGYDEPLRHLAAAAACAKDWDGRLGKPVRQPIGAYLMKLLAAPNAYPALTEFFGQRGYAVRAVSIEQILAEKCARPFCTASCAGAESRLAPSSAVIAFEMMRR